MAQEEKNNQLSKLLEIKDEISELNHDKNKNFYQPFKKTKTDYQYPEHEILNNNFDSENLIKEVKETVLKIPTLSTSFVNFFKKNNKLDNYNQIIKVLLDKYNEIFKVYNDGFTVGLVIKTLKEKLIRILNFLHIITLRLYIYILKIILFILKNTNIDDINNFFSNNENGFYDLNKLYFPFLEIEKKSNKVKKEEIEKVIDGYLKETYIGIYNRRAGVSAQKGKFLRDISNVLLKIEKLEQEQEQPEQKQSAREQSAQEQQNSIKLYKTLKKRINRKLNNITDKIHSVKLLVGKYDSVKKKKFKRLDINSESNNISNLEDIEVIIFQNESQDENYSYYAINTKNIEFDNKLYIINNDLNIKDTKTDYMRCYMTDDNQPNENVILIAVPNSFNKFVISQ